METSSQSQNGYHRIDIVENRAQCRSRFALARARKAATWPYIRERSEIKNKHQRKRRWIREIEGKRKVEAVEALWGRVRKVRAQEGLTPGSRKRRGEEKKKKEP